MTSPTAASGGARRRLPTNVSFGSWELIWSHVHRVLVVNTGLAVGCLPLLAALAATRHPLRHPLPFTVLSLCVGPALAAAFGYLEQAGSDEPSSAAALPRAYRRNARRALALWTPYTLFAAACATDALALRHSRLGLAVAPGLAVVAVLSAGSGVLAMAHVAAKGAEDDPDALPLRPRDYLAAPYALLRRWPLGLMNLALLLVTAALVNQAPLLGLATLPGCALFVVWRNSQAMAPVRMGAAPGQTLDASPRPSTGAPST